MDDIVCIFESQDDAHNFFRTLNEDGHLKFTMESENNGCLNFLDISIKINNSSINTSVYSKPTAGSRTIHPLSSNPKSVLFGTLNTQRLRAHALCNSEAQVQQELARQVDKFVRNGHRKALVCERLYRPRFGPRERPTDQHMCYLPSSNVSEKLAGFLRAQGINVRFTSGITTKSLLRSAPVKDRFERTGVVYKVPCADCPRVYVGQTGRKLNTRIREHDQCKCNSLNDNHDRCSSALACHVHIEGHKVDRDQIEILDVDRIDSRRLVKESIAIIQNKHILVPHNQCSKTISPFWHPLIK